MDLQTLKVATRESRNKGAINRLRRGGDVPCVLYGEGKEPLSIQVERRVFEKLLQAGHGLHSLFQLEVEDNPKASSPVLLKSLQHHPVRTEVLHADFLRIRLDKKIQTSIAIVLTGRSKGVLEGGVVDHQLRDLEVECLAMELPESIELDISDLDIGDGLHVSDIAEIKGVTVLTDPERAIVAIHQPRVVKSAEEEAAEAEAAEAEAAEAEEGEEGEAGEEDAEKE